MLNNEPYCKALPVLFKTAEMSLVYNKTSVLFLFCWFQFMFETH